MTKRWLWLLVLPASLPLVAKEKKLIGNLLERDLLSKAQSYCVDVSKLPESEARDASKFLNAESRPKKLLSRIPWQLVSSCVQADVVVRVEFSQQLETTQTLGGGTIQGVPMTSIPVIKFQGST